MKRKKSVQQNLFYRFRYQLAILAIIIVGLLMVVWDFWATPNGLTSAELSSINGGRHLSLIDAVLHPIDSAGGIIEAPWRLLQSLSMSLFGLDVIGVRLPAVILGLILVALLMLVAYRLFGGGAAMMAGVLAVLSGSVIQYAHSGTSHILGLAIAVSIVLMGARLLSTSAASSSGRLWLDKLRVVLLATAFGLMIYMPGGLYFDLAILVCSIIHPTVRLRIMSDGFLRIVGSTVAVIVALPMLVSLAGGLIFGQHQIIDYLFAFNWPSMNDLLARATSLAGFEWGANSILQPMMTVGGLALSAVGVCCLLGRHARSSVRTYLIIDLTATCLVLATFKPQAEYLLYLPLFLAMVTGLYFLTAYWNGLFPRNPYARVFALFPMCALIVSISVIDAGQYFIKFNYSPAVVNTLDTTTLPVASYVRQHGDEQIIIIVDQSSYGLYQALTTSKVKVIDEQSLRGDDVKLSKFNKIIIATDNISATSLANRAELSGKPLALNQVLTGWQASLQHVAVIYSTK